MTPRWCRTLVLFLSLCHSLTAFALGTTPASHPNLAGWPVTLGADVIVPPVLADIDGDGIPEAVAGADQLYVFKGDGSLLPGWPQQLPGGGLTSLLVGDLDGDGKPEVLATSDTGDLFAYRVNGSLMLASPLFAPEWGYSGFFNFSLADLDGIPGLEVIATDLYNGKIYAWRHDGSSVPGWPVSFEANLGMFGTTGTAVGDIDGDGRPEVLIPSGWYIYAFHSDGTPVAGWPALDTDSPNVIAIGDMAGDGQYKIFAGSQSGGIYAFNADGSSLAGWPQGGHNPALGDIDGDGRLEVVAGGTGSTMAYRGDGSLVPGWPQEKQGDTPFSPVLGDIDGDGGIEVVERTREGIYAWHADGTLLPNFPIDAISDAWSLQVTPVTLGDLTGSGGVSLLTGSIASDHKLYAFTLPAGPAPLRIPWPMQQRDQERTGGLTARPEIVGTAFVGALGASFSQQLASRNGITPYRFAVVAGSLPPGMTLSASGLLSGTLQTLGEFAFTLQLRDASGTTASTPCTFSVQTVAIDTAELPRVELSTWFSRTLGAGGGNPPYLWSVSGGALPPGLSLDAATGTVSGYPTAAGTFPVTFRVADSTGAAATRQLQVVVTERRTWIDGRISSVRAVETDPQGNVYTVEEEGGPAVVKTDPNGTVLWRCKLYIYNFLGLRRDRFGNLYAASYTPANTVPNAPAPVGVVTKIDPSGRELWTRSTTGRASGLAVDDDGNLYLSGWDVNGWLVKYDPSGNVLWQVDPGLVPDSVAVDSAGVPHLLCSRTIIRMSTSGQELARFSVGSGTASRPELAIDRDDNLIVLAQGSITKLTPSGATLWSTAVDLSPPFSLVTDSERNIYLTGSTISETNYPLREHVKRYDSSGRLVWSKTMDFLSPDSGFDLAIDESGRSLYLAGSSLTESGNHPLLMRLFQPQIITAALPEAASDLPYSQAVAAQRGKTAYTWSLLSGTIPPGLQLDSTTGVISGTPTVGSSYPLTLLVTDANGIGDARSLTLVTQGPPPVIDFSGTPPTGYGPLAVNFSDLSTNSPTSWLWSFGDGTFGTGQNSAHTYTLPGNYSVSLTVNGVNGTETTTKSDFVKVLGCAIEPITLVSQPAASFSDPAAAYAQAQEGDVVMMQSYFFNSGLTLDRNIQVTLKGGYKCGFMGRSGSTVFHDTLRVQDGTVHVDTLTFR